MAVEIEEVGDGLADVVTMTAYLTDVRYNSEFVEVRKEFFEEALYPASTLVTVKALNRPEALLELTAAAVIASLSWSADPRIIVAGCLRDIRENVLQRLSRYGHVRRICVDEGRPIDPNSAMTPPVDDIPSTHV